MEHHQREYIRQNHVELVELTKCNCTLMAFLCQESVLLDVHVETLESIDKQSEWSKSEMLYRILENRPNGYQALKTALDLTRQTGALHILEQLPDPPPGSDEQGLISADAEIDILETPREILALFKNQNDPQNPLVVNVRKPTTDEKVQLEKSKYKLRKAYGFILNIVRFDRHSREGAHVDSANMTKLLEELEFQIFPDEQFRNLDYKSKDDIKTHLDVFRKKCVEDKVDCILIFFGSHGYNDKIYTSDSETLDIYLDVIYKFQFTEEELNKRVAKIFINNSCQNDQPFGDLNQRPSDIEPDVTDTLYIKAQMTKYPANRDPEIGSYFVFVLTCVLMRNAYNTSLMEMLTQVQKYLKIFSRKVSGELRQICPITQLDFDFPFYFFTGKSLNVHKKFRRSTKTL